MSSSSTGSPRTREEHGVISVVVALAALALFVCAALVIDLGIARDTRRQAQNSADASSLAAANVLYPQSGTCSSGGASPCLADAVAAAQSYAATNFYTATTDWQTCTDASMPSGYTTSLTAGIGNTSCISFDSTTAPRVVRVRIPPRTVKTPFARLAGRTQVVIGAAAEASLAQGTKCALCFLGPVATNTSDICADSGPTLCDAAPYGASVAVNDNVTFTSGESHWLGDVIGVVGQVNGAAPTSPFSQAPSFTNPFADVTALDYSSTTTYPVKSNPCGASGGQGVYGNVTLSNNETCNLTPGIYVITGTWTEGNNSLFAGTGVTLYVAPTGKIDFKNGSVSLSAPSTGPTAGFVILADPTATNSIDVQGNGGNGSSLTGKVYAKSAKLTQNGNSKFVMSGGPVVVNGADAVGNHAGIFLINATDVTVGHGSLALSK